MIVQPVDNASQFRDAFEAANRGDQFSYEALGALFDELDAIEGTYVLDVVAICCEYTEYSTVEREAGFYESWGLDSVEELRDHTQVLELRDGGLVIQDF